MDEMLDEKLDEKLALLYHKTAKSYSNSTLGHREIARLEKDELGRYPWLPQSPNLKKNKYLKPSGFATHRGMYHAKPEPEGQVHRPGEFFRFGVAEEELFDCLILFESKLRISDAAFGQVVQYLQNLCPEDSAYAILFDRQSFWLIKSYKTVVCSVQKAKWITKGSKSLFQNFISKNTSPWVAYLTNACIALSVDVVEGDAFLGRGSYGRVFKVIGQDENIFALKILTDFQLFRRERKALIEAEHTGLTIRLVSREYIETIEGWALLMYPVGKPLPRPETREEVRSLFQLLWQLHAKNLVHGDPRVPNVILTEEKALWIDLAELCEACPNLKRRDAEMLTRSIRRLPFRYSLSLALVHSLDSYYQCATQENLDHLAEVVWESVLSAAANLQLLNVRKRPSKKRNHVEPNDVMYVSERLESSAEDTKETEETPIWYNGACSGSAVRHLYAVKKVKLDPDDRTMKKKIYVK
ncbi:hypothetical protein DD237_003546 [Peronospora effusa]|uniref:Protein kinase domain-containing protein n=1 Tax=Peronospora effusa TaxID=542832 RepID=A0A3R7XN83_9STRA|nr:hypothetical protein DD237_003546 [Peronospora effusa]